MPSVYENYIIYLPTMHGKEVAIAPAFETHLSANVMTIPIDTDRLGTFSGECERLGSALECARLKCELALQSASSDFAVSSEGSFGPHPYIPFLPCNQEILYFQDLHRGFKLFESLMSENTNYQMKSVANIDEVKEFAKHAQFPSHGLILRPNIWKDKTIIFKGIRSEEDLIQAFKESRKQSSDGLAWIETDMRAHMNPSRMKVIKQVAQTLAQRLAIDCPRCGLPGWGKTRMITGLMCAECEGETDMILNEVYGCHTCEYEEIKPRVDGKISVESFYCKFCNP